MDIKNKIGRGTCLRLAELGAQVVVADQVEKAVDILNNNAGWIIPPYRVVKLVNTNLTGPMLLTQALHAEQRQEVDVVTDFVGKSGL